MSKESNTSTGGVSLLGLLFILFLGLKLTGFIAWSWWWVTAPLWAPAALGAAVYIVYFVAIIVYAFWIDRKAKRKKTAAAKAKSTLKHSTPQNFDDTPLSRLKNSMSERQFRKEYEYTPATERRSSAFDAPIIILDDHPATNDFVSQDIPDDRSGHGFISSSIDFGGGHFGGGGGGSSWGNDDSSSGSDYGSSSDTDYSSSSSDY